MNYIYNQHFSWIVLFSNSAALIFFNWACWLHYLCKRQIWCCLWLWTREGNIIKLTTFWNGHCIRSVYNALNVAYSFSSLHFGTEQQWWQDFFLRELRCPFRRHKTPLVQSMKALHCKKEKNQTSAESYINWVSLWKKTECSVLQDLLTILEQICSNSTAVIV